MILDTDIEEVLGRRLKTLSPSPTIIWENREPPTTPTRPYLIFDHVPVSRTDDTLTGGGEIASGFIQVTVMAAQNEFSTPAKLIAQAIKALFPYTLRLPVTGGEITITKPPEIQQGYPDGASWRVPVKINYEAS